MSGGRVRAAIAMMRKSLNDLELLIEPDNDPFDGFPPEVVEVHMRDGEIHRRAAPGCGTFNRRRKPPGSMSPAT